MKVTGIIAEYNPFHNGHAYQLEEIKRVTHADYMIIAMSGDFLQRGVPAIMNKYERAKMALLNGADLVFELPSVWATASAEYFAQAGVTLLGSTGVVNSIGYGVETENLDLLHTLCYTLNHAPEAYDVELSIHQKEGLSYPIARTAALCNLLPNIDSKEISDFLAKPNNILALEYEKAIAKWNHLTTSPLYGYPLKRKGDNYHDTTVKSSFASATAIRSLLLQDKDIASIVPENVLPIIEMQQKNWICTADFSEILYYRLLLLKEAGYENFADCSASLSQKISKNLYQYKSFDQFCELLKSKDLTYARISRVLIHILLDITKETYARSQTVDMIPYLRVLGFRSRAQELLGIIKKEASAPLITKVADASHKMSPTDYSLFQKDLFASDLYRNLLQKKSDKQLKNEFTHEIIVL